MMDEDELSDASIYTHPQSQTTLEALSHACTTFSAREDVRYPREPAAKLNTNDLAYAIWRRV